MLELSTPVVKLWDGVLALPMIGTLDSARTQVVMESLLQRIVETGSADRDHRHHRRATVDTLVAQHLLKTVTAIRLMGADCIISGDPPADRADDRAPGRGPAGRHHQGHPRRCVAASSVPARCPDPPWRGRSAGAAAARRSRAAVRSAVTVASQGDSRHGTHPDPAHGRVPAGHHPGRHARPAGHDAAGRPDRADRQRPVRQGVLIDISALEMVDSFIGRMIANISRMSRILDADTVWSACSRRSRSRWSSWDCRWPACSTALDVERGMRCLRERSTATRMRRCHARATDAAARGPSRHRARAQQVRRSSRRNWASASSTRRRWSRRPASWRATR